VDDERIDARRFDVFGQGKLARQVTAKPIGHEEHHLQLEEQMLANCPTFTTSPTHKPMIARRSALLTEQMPHGVS
jgi:hypothetical protein